MKGNELARVLGGMDPGSVSKWLTGARNPPGKKRRVAIEQFLELPDGWLSGRVAETAVDLSIPLKRLKGWTGDTTRARYEHQVELALGILSRAFEEVAEILRWRDQDVPGGASGPPPDLGPRLRLDDGHNRALGDDEED